MLVNRGWIAADPARLALPEVPPVVGTVYDFRACLCGAGRALPAGGAGAATGLAKADSGGGDGQTGAARTGDQRADGCFPIQCA